jgi:hypothetical protein
MQLFNVFGAALLAVLALALPALIIRSQYGPGPLKWMRPTKGLFVWDLIQSELGVTITYLSKFTNTGTSIPPTAAQASQLNAQVAQISLTDTETQAIIVTNWGILLGPSFASFGWPVVVGPDDITSTAARSNSFATGFTFGLGNSNQVYINKLVGAPGGTYIVWLFLPTSFMAKT